MDEFYSLGHGSRSIKIFTNLLKEYSIAHLADIRSYPSSKRNPHFNQENLQRALNKVEISYTWFPDLGGFRRTGLGKESPHVALKSTGFRNYADYMATETFSAAVEKLRRLATLGPTCFMCAETAPHSCHRALLSDYLLVQEFKVIHILDSQRTLLHQLSPLASVIEGRLIYNRSEPQQLELNTHD